MAARSPIRSRNNDVPSYVSFFNRTNRTVNLFWVDYGGKLLRYGRLPPFKGTAMNTFVTHPWIVRDAKTGYPLLMNGKPVFHPSENAQEGPVRTLVWIHIPAIIKINTNPGLKPVPTSLDVRTTAWEGLCCLDIGFRHIMPPWLGAIVTWLLFGTASVFSLLRRALEVIFTNFDRETVMQWDMPVTLKDLLKKIAPITEFGNYRFFEDVSYHDLQQLGFQADWLVDVDPDSEEEGNEADNEDNLDSSGDSSASDAGGDYVDDDDDDDGFGENFGHGNANDSDENGEGDSDRDDDNDDGNGGGCGGEEGACARDNGQVQDKQ